MDERVHLFGIRHHGPGSATSLLNALEALRPSVVLVELPADAQDALVHAVAPGMRPPVALLVHDAKTPKLSRFYPFAEWSPEWCALRWAHANGAPVRAIDLPCGVVFKEETQREEARAAAADAREAEAATADRATEQPAEDEGDAPGDAPSPDAVLDDEVERIARDPLDHLAKIAGVPQGEAWWDAVVERAQNPPEVFAAIGSMMAALRRSVDRDRPAPDPQDESALGRSRWREEMREAHMRRTIRETLRNVDGPIAVVVGAWHVPALAAPVTAKHDQGVLKGRRPSKVEVTWVPWTDQRLATRSGYGAGVTSPAWYRHLWQHRDEPNEERSIAAWMARASRVLRDEGLTASTASAIDATALARSLAAIRGQRRTGLEELRDACASALCHGDEIPLRVVERRLVVGEALGEVDSGVPRQPLAADLDAAIKRLRLPREELPREIALDLRTAAGRAKSALLHRLLLLEIPWAELSRRDAGRGTYRERWTLAWKPEIEVALAEALRFGTTVESAAEEAARQKALETHRLDEVAALVDRALCAELPRAAHLAIVRLQHLAADSADVLSTIGAIGPLSETLRYGTARKIDTSALASLIETLSALVVAGLDHAVRGLDDDGARDAGRRMVEFDASLRRLELDDVIERWLAVLERIAQDAAASRFPAGVATRKLADDGRWDDSRVGRAMGFALSSISDPAGAAGWLEGFLQGDVQLLLHDHELLARLDAWLVALDRKTFENLVPVLRRTFADFDQEERRRLFAAIDRGPSVGSTVDRALRPSPAFVAALPQLALFLGMDLDAARDADRRSKHA